MFFLRCIHVTARFNIIYIYNTFRHFMYPLLEREVIAKMIQIIL